MGLHRSKICLRRDNHIVCREKCNRGRFLRNCCILVYKFNIGNQNGLNNFNNFQQHKNRFLSILNLLNLPEDLMHSHWNNWYNCPTILSSFNNFDHRASNFPYYPDKNRLNNYHIQTTKRYSFFGRLSNAQGRVNIIDLDHHNAIQFCMNHIAHR